MLKEITITNIVLVEKVELPVQPGFNVLSGETGSGKSAIIEALNHLIGSKADPSIVRYGTEKGVIEALFDIDCLPQIKTLLARGGIEYIEGEFLLVRREIFTEGKSRVFINNQQSQVSLLRQIGEQLIEIISQHANYRLLDLNTHRSIIDLFGELEELKENFALNWQKENELKNKISELKAIEILRFREIETCHHQIKELEEAPLKQEEELFAEYTRLSYAEVLANDTFTIYEALSEREILSSLSQLIKVFDRVVKLDSSLCECLQTYQQALAELKEVSLFLRSYRNKIEYNPEKLKIINNQLSVIDKIKKKYGPTIRDAINYYHKTKERVVELENIDSVLEQLQNELKNQETVTNQLASELTERRKKTAKKLEKSLLEQLRPLNMPKAEFFVEISVQKRSFIGDDLVEFLFSPNIGEKRISIKEGASGGELSRLMLALQVLLAGKKAIPTIVFDEIDANIGGETAIIIGEKLREIGNKHQVLCITHFPQVAKFATHHFQVFKREKEGRTITSVIFLDEISREKELSRMAGGLHSFKD
jgi:DNA repair protein RecN (Recombination protein N)